MSNTEEESNEMSIFDLVRPKIGEKNTKTVVREAEIAVDKIRKTLDTPAKRLAEAEANVTQREAQVESAEADAAARALAGEAVNDYTPIQTALAHDRNTVKAHAKALEQVRAEQEPALQAAIAELKQARAAHERYLFVNAAKHFRESWATAIESHREMMAVYNPSLHPQLSVPAFFDSRVLQPWDEVAKRYIEPPVKLKAQENPTRVVTIGNNMYDKYSQGEEVFLTEDEAFEAVAVGAAQYSFDTPETQELTVKAAAARARRKKYGPRYADDFPQQN